MMKKIKKKYQKHKIKIKYLKLNTKIIQLLFYNFIYLIE
jgi:hypothetical protein